MLCQALLSLGFTQTCGLGMQCCQNVLSGQGMPAIIRERRYCCNFWSHTIILCKLITSKMDLIVKTDFRRF